MQQAPHAEILEQAFAAFNEHSAQLEDAYRELKTQVGVLTRELAATRRERQRQQAEKQRLARRLDGLLGALPGGVLVLDGDGTISECNAAALELLGEPLLEQRWQDVVTRSGAALADGELTLASGRRVGISRKRLDGEPGHILLLTDVTETRRLQALLARNERLSEMGEMAARLAHQIRTPLSCAMLYSSHLSRGTLPTEKRQRYAGEVGARLKQLERMVNDMLVFARGGRSTSDTFSPAALLREAARLLEAERGPQDRIEIDEHAEQGDILGNREALLGALTNLGANALQAASDGVTVRFGARRLACGAVELSVSDDGPGMSAATCARIFEPFFTTRPAGTGLGLAVVRSTARAHGGDIDVQSSPGAGARFALRIAQAAADQALPSGAERPALAAAG